MNEYDISDDDLPPPHSEVVGRPAYVPTLLDKEALEVFISTGGSTSDVRRVTGMSAQQAIVLVRRPWFREQLTKRNFVPVTAEDIGQEVAKAAGQKALDRLTSEDYLSTSDLVRLGQLGVAMSKAPANITHQSVQIGSLNQVDLRGLTLDQLQVLAGDGDEVIDV